jgi:hypothetical protein
VTFVETLVQFKYAKKNDIQCTSIVELGEEINTKLVEEISYNLLKYIKLFTKLKTIILGQNIVLKRDNVTRLI